MLCEAVFDLISGHLDGQNTPAEEAALQAHLSECEACRTMMRAMSELELETRSLQVEPPKSLQQNVMERIRTEAQTAPVRKKSRKRLAPIYALVAVAAALALVVGLGVLRLPKLGADYAVPVTPRSASPELAASSEPLAESPPETTFYGQISNTQQATAFASEPPAQTEPAQQTEAATDTKAIVADASPEEPLYAGSGVASGSAPEQFLALIEAEEPRRGPVVAQSEELPSLIYCSKLSQMDDAQVLVIYGPGAGLTELMKMMTPELGEALDTASTVCTGPERTVLRTDVDTGMALAEWCELILPASDEAVFGQQTRCLSLEEAPLGSMVLADSRCYAADGAASGINSYDPVRRCLSEVTELPTQTYTQTLHDVFLAFFGEDSRWLLIQPEQDYVPQENGVFYIVLIPLS